MQKYITCCNNFLVKQYNSILYYFLHFYFVTIFEIFFYIYYIFPYENQLFYQLFYSYINDNIKQIKNTNVLNLLISNSSMNEYYDTCNKDEMRIYYYDENIFMICKIYIICISIVFFSIFVFDINLVYKGYKQLHHCAIDVRFTNEMATLPSAITQMEHKCVENSIDLPITILNDEIREYFNSNMDNNTTTVIEINNQFNTETNKVINFVKYYFQNSEFKKEFLKTLNFILLIGIFEYLFFTEIIKKIKIIDMNIILCNVVKSIDN